MRGSPDFVGLDNYRFALTDDVFWTALWRTVYITVVCLVIEIGLGMAIAILLNRNFPGQDLIKGLCFIPLLIAPLSMSLMWNYMLHIQFGVVNDLIGLLGIEPIGWFSTLGLAFWSIIMISVWQWLPFSIFVLLAGLKSLQKTNLKQLKLMEFLNGQYFLSSNVYAYTLIIIIVLLRSMWL